MSRDYKNLRNKKKPSPEIKNTSYLFSFLIGLIVGAFITSTIFFNYHNKLYDKKSSLAINNKNDIKEINDNEVIDTKIVFDFPTILEEREVAKIPKKEYKEIETNISEDNSSTIYMLQVGSFKNYESADALKAKLAFSGLSASINKKDTVDKGIIFRVFIGPFKDKEKLDEIKTVLSENNVTSFVSIEQKIENKSM